ncbi:hypothetical protein A3G55_00030 [Candidatus Giovannonibacteria bacterium RIFCSPLOWO2_12_FULL_44_25]|nr:MAG: hypothetical protein A2120_02840 [Candidatus Giovannonibacteria bacterium GWA2_45_15]OGF59124.1 MAG: hypothetical protein A2W40_01185 [Candidatus Giovannonibacteria bacterium RIFCSPHIGHO2_01_45_12]OGF60664.1 MAG: hypothetical protein A2656_01450 [Candidatus Giovannonibacteria bacterium RIFCSPHIGHO2_01_FULL_44_100]OGF72615.1 MAG: hypothetical protein A3C05_00765 [Candidatus Giovannonibacteria bacterium RIFCSPHIGHO2_02_FULL_45_40]OGF83732.1 MAG: hypothetical protein A3E63_02945 [Candidatu
MKKTIYIILFILLGIILQFLAHAIIEIWYINLLINNFATYGLGMTWETWVLIHNIGAVVVFLAGAYLGFRQGKYWWHRIYKI